MEKIKGYPNDLNAQMIIALMKAHGIKRVVVSPGTSHYGIVAGMQFDGNFEMYSAVDERGAAYMACGMAAETGDPAVIVCTGSVASRNYFAAITEAYYRQLPILAITAVVRGYAKIGHLYPQATDRTVSPKDTFRFKAQLPIIKDAEDVWQSNILINNAFLELKRHGGGPVHIDLPNSSVGSKIAPGFSAQKLHETRIIYRYDKGAVLPDIPHGKIAVFLATHMKFSDRETRALDDFCATHDAVVFCGHTSGYDGQYKVLSHLAARQSSNYDIFKGIDLLIHIGGPAADEATAGKLRKVKQCWRVDPDGEIRDHFKKLSAVFEMDVESFFRHYSDPNCEPKTDYLQKCLSVIKSVVVPVQELPFSNVYAAAVLSKRLPENAFVFLGLSNTIRAWSMFELPKGVSSNSNTGVRGIDGVLSAFLGASFVQKNRLCFCVLGDLTFFYDMNAIGNRDLGNNVRILLVNDNSGGLMKTSDCVVYNYLGDTDSDKFLAAAGHFGGKSSRLVKNYAESLGFEYLTASSKEQFDAVYERFITPEMTDKPMLFEIFTKAHEERAAFDMTGSIDVSVEGAAMKAAKQILGNKGVETLIKVKRSIENR